eukprot:1616713-Amphidinium_carterae.2
MLILEDTLDCASHCAQPVSVCVLWGDPHINPFDKEITSGGGRGSNVNMYGYGDFWIVKSTDIWIQARYWSTREEIDQDIFPLPYHGDANLRSKPLLNMIKVTFAESKPIQRGVHVLASCCFVHGAFRHKGMKFQLFIVVRTRYLSVH